jgi:hypothetical protein
MLKVVDRALFPGGDTGATSQWAIQVDHGLHWVTRCMWNGGLSDQHGVACYSPNLKRAVVACRFARRPRVDSVTVRRRLRRRHCRLLLPGQHNIRPAGGAGRLTAGHAAAARRAPDDGALQPQAGQSPTVDACTGCMLGSAIAARSAIKQMHLQTACQSLGCGLADAAHAGTYFSCRSCRARTVRTTTGALWTTTCCGAITAGAMPRSLPTSAYVQH